ncbi:MAG TPA: SDR family NAD(P)-dependent oxidoreductase [Steroidobacteraceae bacterium]|nr:SDR family NAD(P)-dependent oxidoreductase [Steroidobacteraceae bacterium]
MTSHDLAHRLERLTLGTFRLTVAKLGGLDILVNNAGILKYNDLTQLSLEDIDPLLNVNVRAPVIASRAAIPHLSKGGRIISIGSYFADRVPSPGIHVYAMTKSALIAFTKGLARELGSREIAVNLVHPGSIDTDMKPCQQSRFRHVAIIHRVGKIRHRRGHRKRGGISGESKSAIHHWNGADCRWRGERLIDPATHCCPVGPIDPLRGVNGS